VGPVDAWSRIAWLAPSGDVLTTWTVTGPDQPDLAVVDDLARWLLGARRMGGSVVLLDSSPELTTLLDLVGLLGEMTGQPEGGKEVLDVEKGMQPGDPVP
jgi:hypothetical protein